MIRSPLLWWVLVGLVPSTLLANTESGPWTASEDPRPQREAVVVGFNRSPRLALAPLRYADDDAVKLASLLRAQRHEVVLLVELDDETRRLYPDLDPGIPTRARVLEALAAARARLDQARAGGAKGALLFAYSGHGDVDREGRGLVYLADGVLTQRDLAAALGEAPEQHDVTIVVDACNAALLVGARGMGSYGDRVPAGSRDPTLDRLAKAGLILSTSGRAEVHEWEQLLSGIFSYEIRSGLLGAADLDDDRLVTYAELDAFVASANARVANPIARLAPTIRGPDGRDDAVIVDLQQVPPQSLLRVDESIAGHIYLRDRDLVRYVDFNKGAERAFWLMLGDSNRYVMVQGAREYAIAIIANGPATLGPAHDSAVLARRGQLHDYLERHLFEAPFDRAFAQTHWSRPQDPPELVELSFTETARLVIMPYLLPLGLGAGVALVGGVSYGAAWLAHGAALDARWADEAGWYNEVASALSAGGIISAGLGGVALVTTAAVLGVEMVSWRLE